MRIHLRKDYSQYLAVCVLCTFDFTQKNNMKLTSMYEMASKSNNTRLCGSWTAISDTGSYQDKLDLSAHIYENHLH